MSNLIEIEQPQQTAVAAVNQPMQLLQIAVQSGADVDKLEKLMALQERWDAQQAKKAYFDALSQMQAEMPIIRKLSNASFATKSGGQMSYAFAKLEDIVEQMKPLLKKFGFSFRFEQGFENGIFIKCIATHKDGHSEECSMVGGADMSGNKNPLQQVASSVTYLRRYTLTGVFGISTADADIDGRIDSNDGMNSSAILPDTLDEITKLYSLSTEPEKMWSWLCGTIAKRQLTGFEDLTEAEAKKAIQAIKGAK